MNERIYELALQAEIAAHNGDHVDVKIMMAKFGALIVRECINILPEKVKIDDLHDGKILVQCGMAIKEHFGVEE